MWGGIALGDKKFLRRIREYIALPILIHFGLIFVTGVTAWREKSLLLGIAWSLNTAILYRFLALSLAIREYLEGGKRW